MCRMFHVKLLGLMLLGACADPGELLYEPADNFPSEVSPGLFRLTTNPGGDFVRAVTADGRVRFAATGLAGGPPEQGVVSADIDTGRIRLEGGAYRTLLPELALTNYLSQPRLLVALLPPQDRNHTCTLRPQFIAPGPERVGWRVFLLPDVDGAAFAGLPRFERDVPAFSPVGFGPNGSLLQPKRIRMLPGLDESERLGTNPWGPAVTPDARYAYVSDADSIWRYDLTQLDSIPVAIDSGAYPVLSADGAFLFFARPVITDSTSTVTTLVYSPLASCTQTLVQFTAARWTLHRRDLTNGTTDSIGFGAEPALLGDTALVVRTLGGITTVRLSDGVATLLIPDPTATSPAVAPDGSFIAFTSRRFGNPDVLFLRLN